MSSQMVNVNLTKWFICITGMHMLISIYALRKLDGNFLKIYGNF